MRIRTLSRAVCAALCVLALFSGCSTPREPEPLVLPTDGRLTHEGTEYVLREDLTTVLIMGLDKYERPEEARGYTNKMQSDFLMLLVLDNTDGSCRLLHLNRDTMTEIRRLGVGGDVAGKFTGQLALAHTYGSGGSDSCLNAVKAVSKLLGGVKIDHYMTLTMDAVGTVNDLVGGVEVTVLHDFGPEYPQLKKGETVLLTGELALAYVRSRMAVGDQTNLQRMERQRQYLEGLFTKLLEKNREIPDFLRDALLRVNDSYVSDMTTSQLEALGESLEGCTAFPILTLPGEARVGEEFMEFYVDEEALKETVLELFYEAAG